MVIGSRNTLLASAFVFLGVVILLRLSGNFVEDNIVAVTGAIFAGRAEDIPLLELDFSSLDVSWLNPTTWSTFDIRGSVNDWMHETIDVVMPATISTLGYVVVQSALIFRPAFFL